MFGRLMRFRPLPVPAEAAEVVNHSVTATYAGIWWNSWGTITTVVAWITALGTLCYALYGKISVYMFLLYSVFPPLVQLCFCVAYYRYRRFMNLKAARSHNRWITRLSGYVSESLAHHADKPLAKSGFDDMMDNFWQLTYSLHLWCLSEWKFRYLSFITCDMLKKNLENISGTCLHKPWERLRCQKAFCRVCRSRFGVSELIFCRALPDLGIF